MNKTPFVLTSVCYLLLFVFISFFALWFFTDLNVRVIEKIPKHFFAINKSYIISLDVNTTQHIVPSVQKYLRIHNVTIFHAVNHSQAMIIYDRLPLYTKYVMKTGRSDHMQISNPSMLGCLLSHISIWKSIQKGETVLILEEDSHFNLQSAVVMEHLYNDMSTIQWDVLMLESGHFIATGQWKRVGNYAATCAQSNITVNICTWFGTRGYLITYEGAKKLLAHTFPVHVQIDAYMGLLAAFNPEFKMYWTRENVVHQKLFHISKIWDGCLKCYVPRAIIFYVIFLAMFVLNVVFFARKMARVYFPTGDMCI